MLCENIHFRFFLRSIYTRCLPSSNIHTIDVLRDKVLCLQRVFTLGIAIFFFAYHGTPWEHRWRWFVHLLDLYITISVLNALATCINNTCAISHLLRLIYRIFILHITNFWIPIFIFAQRDSQSSLLYGVFLLTFLRNSNTFFYCLIL